MDGAGGSGGAAGGLAAAAAAAAAAVAAAAASPGGSGAGGSNSHSLYFDKDGLELAFKYFRYIITSSIPYPKIWACDQKYGIEEVHHI